MLRLASTGPRGWQRARPAGDCGLHLQLYGYARVCRVHRGGRRYRGQRPQLDGVGEQQRIHPAPRERADVWDEAKEPDPDLPRAEQGSRSAAPGAQDG